MIDVAQQDRCSAQQHLWRYDRPGHLGVMSCRCGAVHPDDLDAWLSDASERGCGVVPSMSVPRSLPRAAGVEPQRAALPRGGSPGSSLV